MISGQSGARVLRVVCLGRIVGLLAPLRLAALPFLEEVCYVFVEGILEAELLAAVVLADSFGSAAVMRWMFILHSSLSTLPFLLSSSFVGVLSLSLMC